MMPWDGGQPRGEEEEIPKQQQPRWRRDGSLEQWLMQNNAVFRAEHLPADREEGLHEGVEVPAGPSSDPRGEGGLPTGDVGAFAA